MYSPHQIGGFGEFDDLDEPLFDPDREALRSSVAAETRSPDDPTGIDRKTFDVGGSNQDLEHAKALLDEHGMIPSRVTAVQCGCGVTIARPGATLLWWI